MKVYYTHYSTALESVLPRTFAAPKVAVSFTIKILQRVHGTTGAPRFPPWKLLRLGRSEGAGSPPPSDNTSAMPTLDQSRVPSSTGREGWDLKSRLSHR